MRADAAVHWTCHELRTGNLSNRSGAGGESSHMLTNAATSVLASTATLLVCGSAGSQTRRIETKQSGRSPERIWGCGLDGTKRQSLRDDVRCRRLNVSDEAACRALHCSLALVLDFNVG